MPILPIPMNNIFWTYPDRTLLKKVNLYFHHVTTKSSLAKILTQNFRHLNKLWLKYFEYVD